jgi:hypothetical protein
MRDITLQRRHFEMIADVISDIDIPSEYRKKVTSAFSRRLSRTNPLFEYEKFIKRAMGDQNAKLDGRSS